MSNNKSTSKGKSTDVKELHDTIEFIDHISSDASSEIVSIAKLALFRLESPDAYMHLNDIANALSAIWVKAMDANNSISVEAEGVGCNYVDEAQMRRLNAQSASYKIIKG